MSSGQPTRSMSRRGVKGSRMGGNDVLTIDQLRHQDDWVLDTERYRCHVCTRNFTHFRRKHHCRKVRFFLYVLERTRTNALTLSFLMITVR
jgi:hypothetical protein